MVQRREQVSQHMTTGHGGAMRRDDARDAPGADAERLLQGDRDAGGERGAGMVARHMCGIAGEFAFEREQVTAAVSRMIAALRHRWPAAPVLPQRY